MEAWPSIPHRPYAAFDRSCIQRGLEVRSWQGGPAGCRSGPRIATDHGGLPPCFSRRSDLQHAFEFDSTR